MISSKIKDDQTLYRGLLISGKHLFMQAKWWDVITGEEGWSAKIGMDSANNILWAWPYTVSGYMGIQRIVPPAITSYNDVLVFDSHSSKEALRELTEALPFFSLVRINQRIPTEMDLPEGADRTMKRLHRFLLRDSVDEHWCRIHPRKRNMIRWGRKRLKVSECESGSTLIKGINSSSERNHIPTYSAEFIDRLFANFEGTMGRVVSDTSGKVLGSLVVVVWNRTAYAVLGGKSYDHRKMPVMELLYWEMIQWAFYEQFEIDLCGSNIPGVAAFNLRMGAEEIKYQSINIYKPMIMKSLYRWYKSK